MTLTFYNGNLDLYYKVPVYRQEVYKIFETLII